LSCSNCSLRQSIPDFAIELGDFFDDENACFWPFSFEHERSRRAGKRAADDHDIVFQKMAFGGRKRNQFRSAIDCWTLGVERWTLTA